MASRARKRGSISRDEVISAALGVVDDVGVNALTIRRVAARAGLPAMSLYSHFATKEDLIELMSEEASRRLYSGSGEDCWQAECARLCHHVRRLLLAHPRWIPLLSTPAAAVPFAVRDRVLRLMAEDGIPPGQALQAFHNLALLAVGFSLAELTLRPPRWPVVAADGGESLHGSVPAGAFDAREPVTEPTIGDGSTITMTQSFHAAVRVFIAGVAAERPRGR